MWLTVFKGQTLVRFVVIVFVVILGLALLFWDEHRSIQQRQIRAAKVFPDILRATALCAALEHIYERTGLLFTNRPTMERSAFYPFIDSYKRGCAGGYLEIGYVEGEKPFWVVLKWNDNQTQVVCRRDVPAEKAEKRTQRLLNFYLSGVRGILNVVNEVRQRFLERHRHAVKVSKGTCTLHWQDKPSLAALRLTGDLPTSESELRMYVQWLSLQVVGGVLTDGWNKPIVLSLERGYLLARSAGEDGQLHTDDDIVLRRRAVSNSE